VRCKEKHLAKEATVVIGDKNTLQRLTYLFARSFVRSFVVVNERKENEQYIDDFFLLSSRKKNKKPFKFVAVLLIMSGHLNKVILQTI